MTYNTASFYVTFGGPTFAGKEQWQTGLHFTPMVNPGPATEPLLDALDDISTDDILQDVTQLISAHGTVHWGNSVAVSWAKIAVLNTQGKYAGDPKASEQLPVVGGFSAQAVPPQLAAVVSQWSGSNLGRANHGRNYLPLPLTWYTSFTVNEPRVTAQAAADLRDAWIATVNDIQGEVDTASLKTQWSIMSSIDIGRTRPVAHVGCGRVIDTMRSRRESLDEEHVWWPYDQNT